MTGPNLGQLRPPADVLELDAEPEQNVPFSSASDDGRHAERYALARLMAPMGGCNCTPEIDIELHGRTWHVSYGHDRRCRRLASLQRRN